MSTENLDLITGKRLDIDVYQGNTIAPAFTFTQGEPATPLNLTGVSIVMQIRKCEDSATVVKEFKTSDSSITISGDDSNIVTVIGAVDIDGGAYKYDMRFTFPAPGNQVVTYLYGDMNVTKKVTRS
jgi:hypothetical protein